MIGVGSKLSTKQFLCRLNLHYRRRNGKFGTGGGEEMRDHLSYNCCPIVGSWLGFGDKHRLPIFKIGCARRGSGLSAVSRETIHGISISAID